MQVIDQQNSNQKTNIENKNVFRRAFLARLFEEELLQYPGVSVKMLKFLVQVM